MKSWFKGYWAYIIVVCALAVLVFFGFGIPHAISVCKVMTQQAIANGYPATRWDCFDFWLNRYQTLLVGVPTVVVASLAARAAYKGLRTENARVAWEYNASAAEARQKSRDLVKMLTRIATSHTTELDSLEEMERVEPLLSETITLVEKAGFAMPINTVRLRKLVSDVIFERKAAQIDHDPRSNRIKADRLKPMLEKIWEIEAMFMPPESAE